MKLNALDLNLLLVFDAIFRTQGVTLASQEVVQAAISVGRRPTFYEYADPLIECYLLDFNRDLYGEHLEVTFVEKLRDEQRFETVDALIEQMHRDVAATRTILAAAE